METVGNTFFFDWEVSLIEWLQSTIGGAAGKVLSFFSAFGEELLLIAVLGFIYWSLDKKLGYYVGMNLLIANIFCSMGKSLLLRRRPYLDHPEVSILRPVDPSADLYDIAAQGYSFPSGHNAMATAQYGSIARYTKKKPLVILAFVLPLLVGLSRVYVGAHYPTDVFAGWLIGAAALFGVPLLQKVCRRRVVFFPVVLLLTVPGFFFCRCNDYFTTVGMLFGFMAAIVFEEKKVHFQNTRNPLRMVLRVLVGGGLFFGLNSLMKLPFTKEFLDGGSFGALMVRFARYAIILFLLLGVYPMVFQVFDRFFKNKKTEEKPAEA